MIRTLSAALALLSCAHAYAAICTWTGAGADDKWSNKNNWDTCQGIREVPLNTDALIFPDGAARKINTNDIVNLQPASLQLNGLNYDISGNAITLTPSATSGISVNTPTGGFADLGPRFRPDIKLGGTQTFSCAAGKFLYIDGDLNLNGKQLGIDGSCNTALRGSIFGSGDITKFGAGFLYLAFGPYSYGGIVTVNDGTVYVGTDTGLGATASSTYVESGATLSLYLGVTIDESLFLTNGTLENFLGDNTVDGDVTLSSNSSVDVLADTTLTVNGVVTGGLVKKGTGTLVLNDVNNAGFIVYTGLLQATGNVMGPVIIDAGATFVASGAMTSPLVVSASGTLWTGTRATPGTLQGQILQWDPNGYFHARLGKKADRLVLASNLYKNNDGFRRFVFADGVTPPVQGVEYTLIEYPQQSGYEVAGSLTYTYEGTGPGASLTGNINVSDTKITFTVISVVSDLVFRDGVEP